MVEAYLGGNSIRHKTGGGAREWTTDHPFIHLQTKWAQRSPTQMELEELQRQQDLALARLRRKPKPGHARRYLLARFELAAALGEPEHIVVGLHRTATDHVLLKEFLAKWKAS